MCQNQQEKVFYILKRVLLTTLGISKFLNNYSPEVWKDQPYSNKSDIWSLGCVLYEMTMLKPPYRADDMEGLYKKVIRGVYPKISSHFSQDLSSMIKWLL